jgi:hypothetical protein
MAKTIRPILCPQCGSPAKTTLGPDLFCCAACQTEYYLDTDEVSVTVHHQYAAPPVAPPRAVAPRSWGASLLLLVALGALTWLAMLAWGPGRARPVPVLLARPVFYRSQYV